MKGTAPRDFDPVEDARLAEALRASGKDRAENLMIVDLLRNDISRLCRVGSVKVPELFHVESYATVHQMVSRSCGQLEGPASLAGVMAALFPCGSITGAPKLRAMQIIAEVEPWARGAYCGAIGWMGRYLVIGFAGGPIPKIPLNLPLLKSCDIIGVFWGEVALRNPTAHTANIARVLAWISTGALKPHVHAVLPLEQIGAALGMLDRREVTGKLVLAV